MTYADLIKLLEPHANEKVFFNGYENREDTEVHFYTGGMSILILNRRYGKDDVTIEQI